MSLSTLALLVAVTLGQADGGSADASTEAPAEAALDAGAVAHDVVLEVEPGSPRPGDLVLVTVRRGPQSPVPEGTFLGHPLKFFRYKHGFHALAGLSVDMPVGPQELTVELRGDGGTESFSTTVDVVEPHFRESELKVANKFISPPASVKAQIKEDKKAFAQAFNQPFVAPLFSKSFAWPRPPRVTAPFGDRRIFNGKLQSQHFGTDLDGHTGDEIVAANDGTVVLSRGCYASGNTVLVHHGAQLYTAYFHMSRIDVNDGDKVKRGQHLGLVGKTGRVTGPHLHFGVKVNGLYVDSESLLRLDFEK